MNRERGRGLHRLLLLLLIVLTLPSCGGVEPTSVPPTPTPLQNEPTNTSSPYPTSSPTSMPTSTPTATPTPTNTPLPPNLALTPIVQTLPPITRDVLDQVQLMGIWGNGAPNEIVLSGDGSLLAVGTDLGTFLYDSFDFRFITLLRSEHPVEAISFSPDNQLISVIEGVHRLTIYDQSQFEPVEEINLSTFSLPEEAPKTLFFSPESDSLTLMVETNGDIEIFHWEITTWEAAAHFSVPTGLEAFVNPSVGVLGVITEENLILHSLALPGDFRNLPLPTNQTEVEQAIQTDDRSVIIPASSGDFLLLNQGTTVAYWDILENEIDYHLEEYPQQVTDPCEQIPDTCLNTKGEFSFQCPAESKKPPVKLLSLTPDDQRMLLTLNSNRTELRSTFSGELIWEIQTGYTKSIFSLNDRFLLGLRPDGTLEKRDLQNGDLLLTLKQHPIRFFDLAFSPDGSLLAAGFNDDWIRVYSTQTGEMLGILEGAANRLKFSPSGEQLAAGLTDGQVRIFELARGRFFDLGRGHLGPVTGLVFSPNGTRLTTASKDCAINHWNITDRYRTGFIIPGRENPFQILDLEESAKSDLLFASSASSVWQIEDETSRPVFSTAQEDDITNIALTADGQLLAIGGDTVWLRKTDPSTAMKITEQVTAPSESPFHPALLPEAHLLILVNAQEISFYALEDNQPSVLLHQLALPPSLGQPMDLAISPSGDLIAIGSENGLIHIFGIPGSSN